MPSNLYDCRVIDVGAEDEVLRETPPCMICGQQRSRAVFRLQDVEWLVVRCLGCGLGKLLPQPSEDIIRSFYPDPYYGSSGRKFRPMVEAAVRWVAARQAKRLAQGLSNGARILDVGCGRGVMLSALADLGMQVAGFEVSETAAIGVDRRAEVRIGRRLNDVHFSDESFDQVILWHVLEHVPHPRETLMEVHRVLKTGGRLVVAVPNFASLQARWAGAAWFHLDLPRHLFHFPVHALRRLMTECGFQCEREVHFSLRQNPFGWVQSAQNLWPALPRNGLYHMLQQNQADYSRRVRILLRAWWMVASPPAVVLSVLTALARSGATVQVTARRARLDDVQRSL